MEYVCEKMKVKRETRWCAGFKESIEHTLYTLMKQCATLLGFEKESIGWNGICCCSDG